MSLSVQRYHNNLFTLLKEYVELSLTDEAISTLALLIIVDKYPKDEKVIQLATLANEVEDLSDEFAKQKNYKGETAVKLNLTIQKKQFEHRETFKRIESTEAYKKAFQLSPPNVAQRIRCPSMPPPLPRL